jgi:ATP-GRASP peptide maturase of grasp-with-spasm system
MILIQSNSLDEITNDVINELLFLGYEVLRINENTTVNIHKVGLDTITFEVGNVVYDLKQITTFWHRKTTTFFGGHLQKVEFSENIKPKLNAWLNTEIEVLRSYWFSALETRCKHLGNYELSTPNKLLFLEQATKVGLSVPATLITSYKEELLNFKAIHKNIITKPIQDVFSIRHEGYFYTSYTNEVTDLEIEPTENTFFPALFQQKIDKKYELRVFYLAGNCYTMAIFSQTNDEAKLDFRINPKNIREVPFKLPNEIANKIQTLMQNLNLNTGSIDLIVTTNKEYIFLEINPVGQFGMVSFPCNYHLENKVAHFLIA